MAVVADLGVADAMDGTPRTAADLAAKKGMSHYVATILLDGCAAVYVMAIGASAMRAGLPKRAND